MKLSSANLLISAIFLQAVAGQEVLSTSIRINSDSRASLDTCIFKATSASQLKSNNYRNECKSNLETLKFPHWTPLFVDGIFTWKNVVLGDEQAKADLIASDCDHILEGQTLHNFIGNGKFTSEDSDYLCKIFDEANNKRSYRVKSILNGSNNMRFIHDEINQTKGRFFGKSFSASAAVIAKERSQKFVTAMDIYVKNVSDNHLKTVTDIDAVFAEFALTYQKELTGRFDLLTKRFLNHGNAALSTFHNRTNSVITQASKVVEIKQ